MVNTFALKLVDKIPTPETFWGDREHFSVRDEDKHRPIEELIREAEVRLGVLLPEHLKTLYRQANGGYTDYCFYPIVADPRPVYGDWDYVIVDGQLFPLSELELLGGIADFTDNDELLPENRVAETDRLVVLTRHGWDVFLCLDYRANGPHGEPEIVFLTERNRGKEGYGGLREVFRVSNFEVFFNGLRREG
jgi:SMI1-KNR4 cell-wall